MLLWNVKVVFTSTINIKTVEEKRKSLDKYLKWMRRFKLHSSGKYTRQLLLPQQVRKYVFISDK